MLKSASNIGIAEIELLHLSVTEVRSSLYKKKPAARQREELAKG